MRTRVFLLPSLALAHVACASAVRFEPDAAVTDTSVADTPAEAASAEPDIVSCGALANVGDLVPTVEVPVALPAPAGGSVIDGTYVLTERLAYTGPGGRSGATSERLRSTLLVRSGGFELVNGDGAAEQRFRGAFTTMGAEARFAPECPPGSSLGRAGFTATPTQLTFFGQGSVRLASTTTYTRR